MARWLAVAAALVAMGSHPAGAQEVAPPADKLRELCGATAGIAAAVERSEGVKATLVEMIAAAKSKYEPERQKYVDCVEGRETDGCDAAFDGQLEADLAADREALDRMEAGLQGLNSELARFAELRRSITELIGAASCGR